jgi:CBS domain containing-hemolysin-like protein
VPEGRYETLGGYLAEQLQRLPAVGDTVPVEGGELTVETIEGRRVARVRALMREGYASGATAVRLVEDDEKEPVA